MRSERGFTLLEMVLVVAAIALLTAIALPNLLMARDKAKEVVCRANRHTLERLEQLFAQEKGRYSYSVEELMASDYYADQKGCPKGGVYFWVDFPEDSPLYHSIIGCSVHGIDTTSDENEEIFPVLLFSSDFDDPSQWKVVRGRWTIKDGVAHAGPRGENRAFAGDESWTNYVVAADARVVKGKGLGIYFRASDVKRVDGYIFQVDPGYGRGKLLFRKLVNGRETRPFALADPPEGFDWYAPHHIEIKVENDTFTAYVDGKEVLHSADDTYTNGMIGMRTWNGSEAEFTNMEVRGTEQGTESGGGTPPPEPKPLPVPTIKPSSKPPVPVPSRTPKPITIKPVPIPLPRLTLPKGPFPTAKPTKIPRKKTIKPIRPPKPLGTPDRKKVKPPKPAKPSKPPRPRPVFPDRKQLPRMR